MILPKALEVFYDRTANNIETAHNLHIPAMTSTQEQEKQATGSPVPRGFGSTRYRKDGPVNI
jgi:hypothetical protein